MTRKKKSDTTSRVVQVPAAGSDTPETRQAKNVITPTVRAAFTVESFSKVFGDTDLGVLICELQKQANRVHDGDLKRAESTLTAQAHTLDTIFHELARRSALNMGEYLDAAERYMRLALKAQSQCRATLETLATIKNPPVIYAKQANIANGPQQVNNVEPLPAREESVIEQNELLEHQHGKWLDNGATSTPIGADQRVETMGTIHRA
ncbi:hypothetical protein [Dechloromonas sp.]|uniref:hypothetical protein n=1 Tax=Dechloromonas sp. TaxID=1917218 RepID=UPI00263F841C|nr:hypothetical protein [Dechloromonas sp.]